MQRAMKTRDDGSRVFENEEQGLNTVVMKHAGAGAEKKLPLYDHRLEEAMR